MGDLPGCGEGFRGVGRAGFWDGAELGEPGAKGETGAGIWEDVGVCVRGGVGGGVGEAMGV